MCPWLCKYLLSLDHNRGDIGMRMNTNSWNRTFDRFLCNEYSSDCALGLSIEYSQDFVVPIYIYWTVCLYQCTHPPSLPWPFFPLGPTAHIIQPDTCGGGASFWKAHTTCQWEQPSPSAPPSPLHQLHYWIVLLLHWAVHGTVHPGHCHHCRGW